MNEANCQYQYYHESLDFIIGQCNILSAISFKNWSGTTSVGTLPLHIGLQTSYMMLSILIVQ